MTKSQMVLMGVVFSVLDALFVLMAYGAGHSLFRDSSFRPYLAMAAAGTMLGISMRAYRRFERSHGNRALLVISILPFVTVMVVANLGEKTRFSDGSALRFCGQSLALSLSALLMVLLLHGRDRLLSGVRVERP